MPWAFLLLLLLLIASFGINICAGDIWISPGQAMSILCHWQQHLPSAVDAAAVDGLNTVIMQIRLPRLLLAAIVGVGLSVSGYLLQTLSRNDLADPYLTGVSSGAGFAVALAFVLGLNLSFVPLVAFAGGITASLVVAFMARGPAGLSITRLLLAGVAVSAVCGGLITLVLVMSSNAAQAQGLFFWLAGGIAGHSWSDLNIAAFYVAVGVLLALLMSKPLQVLSAGAETASSVGLNVVLVQWSLLAIAVLMCGACVSVSGLVGFVGLIAPHISRRFFPGDKRVQIITCAMIGASIVLLSDLAARTLAPSQELPLGMLLALVGGPFFLWLVVRQKSEGL